MWLCIRVSQYFRLTLIDGMKEMYVVGIVGDTLHKVGLTPGRPLSLLINPRRACVARVTVLGLCVCLSVCLLVHPKQLRV